MDNQRSPISSCAHEPQANSSYTTQELPAQATFVAQLELGSTNHLHGANRWSRGPVLEAELNLSPLADDPTMVKALVHGLQIRAETVCSNCAPEISISQVAWAVAKLAADLQQSACRPLEAPFFQPRSIPGQFVLVIPCEEFAVAELALQLSLSAANKIIRGETWDVDPDLQKLYVAAEQCCLGPSTFAISSAARKRGIPVDRWVDNSLLRLGQGNRQRRIWTGVSDQTSSLADSIVKDKELTRQLLRSCGLPVPVGRPVDCPEEAWRTACELGLPVVVKPRDGNHSRGVCLNLHSRTQIEDGFREAAQEGAVMVERMVPGQEHRVLVVGERVIAAALRRPAQVQGDGQHTVAELVQIANRDHRRGGSPLSPMRPLIIDNVAAAHLAEQGMRIDSIPQNGQSVLLRRIASITRGGTARDVTATIHPEVAAICVAAAGIVGLDIAGIDVVARDLSRPLEEQQGAIVEVNAGPGLSMHLDPWPAPEPVGQAILQHLFPTNSTEPRIPVIACRGPLATENCQQLATALQRHVRQVGVICRDGVLLNSRPLERRASSIADNVRQLLWNPHLETLLFEAVDQQILQTGVGVDRLDWLIDSPPPNGAANCEVTQFLSSLLADRTRRVALAENKLPDSLVRQICQYVGRTTFTPK